MPYVGPTEETTCPFCKGSGKVYMTRRDSLTSPEDWAGIIHEEAVRAGLMPADLLSRAQYKRVAKARHIAMARLRDECDLTWKHIGQLLGNRDHSTAMSGARNGLAYLAGKST